MDRPEDRNLGDDVFEPPTTPTQAELESIIDADDAAVAASETAALEPVLSRMRETAERVRHDRQHKEATAHRRA